MANDPEGAFNAHRQLDPIALKANLARIKRINGIQQRVGLR